MESSNFTINFEFLKDIDDPGYESMLKELHTKCCEVERAKMFSPENCLFSAGTACEAAVIYYLKKTRGFAGKDFSSNCELASASLGAERLAGAPPREDTFREILYIRRKKRNFAHPEAGQYESYEDTVKGDTRLKVDRAVDGRPSSEETERALSDTFFIVSTVMRAVWPDLRIPAYGKLPSSADDYRHEIAVRTNRAMLERGREAFSAYEKSNPYEPKRAETGGGTGFSDPDDGPRAELRVYKAPLYNKDKGLYELGLLAEITGRDARRLRVGYRFGEDRANGERLLIGEKALGREITALLRDRESGRVLAELSCGSFGGEDVRLADQSLHGDPALKQLVAIWPEEKKEEKQEAPESAKTAAGEDPAAPGPEKDLAKEPRPAGEDEQAPEQDAPKDTVRQSAVDEDYERFKAISGERESGERTGSGYVDDDEDDGGDDIWIYTDDGNVFPDPRRLLRKIKRAARWLLAYLALAGLIFLCLWEGIGWKYFMSDANGWLRVSKTAAAVDYDKYPYTGDSVPPWMYKEDPASIKRALIFGSPRRLGDKLLAGAVSLELVYIPKSVTAIGDRVFEDCSSMKEVALPKGLVSIGEDAFKGCDSLEVVHFTGTAEEFGQIQIGAGNEALLNARLDAAKE